MVSGVIVETLIYIFPHEKVKTRCVIRRTRASSGRASFRGQLVSDDIGINIIYRGNLDFHAGTDHAPSITLANQNLYLSLSLSHTLATFSIKFNHRIPFWPTFMYHIRRVYISVNLKRGRWYVRTCDSSCVHSAELCARILFSLATCLFAQWAARNAEELLENFYR